MRPTYERQNAGTQAGPPDGFRARFRFGRGRASRQSASSKASHGGSNRSDGVSRRGARTRSLDLGAIRRIVSRGSSTGWARVASPFAATRRRLGIRSMARGQDVGSAQCFVASEGNATTLAEVVAGIAESVDRLNLVLRKGSIREPWMDRIRKSQITAGRRIRFIAVEPVGLLRAAEGRVGYPAGLVRRMIAAYDNIALSRKVVGVDGVVFSDFYDGLRNSQLHYRCDQALQRPSLVNQLGFEGIVFRGGDVDDFPSIDLLAPQSPLSFAIQCFRRFKQPNLWISPKGSLVVRTLNINQ